MVGKHQLKHAPAAMKKEAETTQHVGTEELQKSGKKVGMII